jgi:hypothetical protein
MNDKLTQLLKDIERHLEHESVHMYGRRAWRIETLVSRVRDALAEREPKMRIVKQHTPYEPTEPQGNES